MNIYRIEWDGRSHPRKQEWFGTQREMIARRAEIRKEATRRPFEQIEIIRSGKVDFPTDKSGLVTWLNTNLSVSQSDNKTGKSCGANGK